jgi:hypothetical protein
MRRFVVSHGQVSNKPKHKRTLAAIGRKPTVDPALSQQH